VWRENEKQTAKRKWTLSIQFVIIVSFLASTGYNDDANHIIVIEFTVSFLPKRNTLMPFTNTMIYLV
jgi:hypothetical protein